MVDSSGLKKLQGPNCPAQQEIAWRQQYFNVILTKAQLYNYQMSQYVNWSLACCIGGNITLVEATWIQY